jgi:thioredoxin-related protein
MHCPASPRSFRHLLLCTVLAMFAFTTHAADTKPDPKGPAAKIPAKPLTWYTTYQQACAEARKADKLIIAYFCGSDWDEWTKKLDKEVLKTDMFREWAEQNVILLKFDLLKFSGSSTARDTIEKYKIKYNISKVPTLLFLDSDGLLIARCGYGTASLREDEDKGKPVAWIKYCEETIKNRPPPQKLISQKTMDEAIAASRKHYLPLVILLAKSDLPLYTKKRTDLLKNQPFVQFVNQNFAFCDLKWPEATDKSPEAVKLKAFIEENKVAPIPLQLIVYDYFVQPPTSKIKDRFPVVNLQDIDPLIERLDKNVSNPDYSGAWLDDWRQATFISNRLKKPLFIAFTSMDSSEPSRKFDAEIFQTDEFKKFAKKNLVLMKVEFPGKEENIKLQPDGLKEQNRSLADQYAIRGYPMVIILNFMGQRIGESKYMKGGPEFFLKQLEEVIKSDRFSRP